MTFSSTSFLLFCLAIFLIYLAVKDKYRWVVLLGASLVFYAALKIPYLLLALFFVIGVTYLAGLRMEASKSEAQKKLFFWSGIALNLLALICLKYSPFLAANLNAILHVIGPMQLIPPISGLVSIGVSFYVFQAISYLADIYLGTQPAEHHLGIFALYISFFPKLMQGPIERASHLLPQLHDKYHFNYEAVRAGLILFAWGLFKKVVIADRLALFVNAVYNDVHAFNGVALIIATYLYALQIYFDFSGYTDMALGVGRLFNIQLVNNFNSPYLATSIADFWRRWHISFSQWIMDYIFKPLQMQFRNWRVWGTVLALLVTFLFSGLWHGANWGVVLWGLLHGVYLSSAVILQPYLKRVYKNLHIDKSRWLKAWQIFATFQLVSFAWIFFRASNVADAAYVATHLFTGVGNYLVALVRSLAALHLSVHVMAPVLLGQSTSDLVIILLGLIIAAGVHVAKPYFTIRRPFFKQPAWFRWCTYYALLIMILMLGVFSNSQFLYFQF